MMRFFTANKTFVVNNDPLKISAMFNELNEKYLQRQNKILFDYLQTFTNALDKYLASNPKQGEKELELSCEEFKTYFMHYCVTLLDVPVEDKDKTPYHYYYKLMAEVEKESPEQKLCHQYITHLKFQIELLTQNKKVDMTTDLLKHYKNKEQKELNELEAEYTRSSCCTIS